jgi:hypothetical protein
MAQPANSESCVFRGRSRSDGRLRDSWPAHLPPAPGRVESVTGRCAILLLRNMTAPSRPLAAGHERRLWGGTITGSCGSLGRISSSTPITAEITTSGFAIWIAWVETGTNWLRPRVDKAA